MGHPDIPTELFKAIQKGECIAFIGAGISRNAGLPTWKELLTHKEKGLLVGQAHSQVTSSTVQDELNIKRQEVADLVNRGEYIAAAGVVKDYLGTQEYLRRLTDIFDAEDTLPTKTHKLLPKLNFRAILTTNFDTLISNAFQDIAPIHQSSKQALGLIRPNKSYILHVHGIISLPETIVFTADDYDQIASNEYDAYRLRLSQILQDNTVLYLGYGHGDPDIEMMYKYLGDTFNDARYHYHYSLLPDSADTTLRNALKKSNVKILPYQTRNTDEHPEVHEFLVQLGNMLDNQPNNVSQAESLPPKQQETDSNESQFEERLKLLIDQNDGLLTQERFASLISSPEQSQTSEDRDQLSQKIIEDLSTYGNYLHMVGLPGVGKTRFILEIIINNKMERNTLYVLNPSVLPANFFGNPERNTTKQFNVIVDNCSFAESEELFRLHKFYASKLNIITIESNSVCTANIQNTADPCIYFLPRLPDKAIENVIKQVASYRTPDHTWQITHLAQGNLNLALSIARTINLNPKIKGNSELFNFLEIRQAVEKIVPANVDPVAIRALSLMQEIGLKGHAMHEGLIISKIVGVEIGRLQVAATQMEVRGLSKQHGRYYEIMPSLLAIYLGIEAWHSWGEQIVKLMLDDECPERMRRSLLKRLGVLGNEEISSVIARRLFYG